MDEAVRIVARVCRMCLFDLPVFPRRCLRRSLALHSVLTRMGLEVEIHFGVRKEGPDLHGHSWVTVDGVPVAERSPAEAFRPIFSYRFTPPDASLRPVDALPSG
jgi:Transglutaminase-like superfamily